MTTAKRKQTEHEKLTEFLSAAKASVIARWEQEASGLDFEVPLEQPREYMEQLYDIMTAEAAQRSEPFGGEALTRLLSEQFERGLLPRDIARLQMLLADAVRAVITEQKEFRGAEAAAIRAAAETLIDESRLRIHEFYDQMRAESLRETQQRAQRFAAIGKISTALIAAETKEDIARIVHTELRRLMPFDHSIFCLARDSGRNIELYHSSRHEGGLATVSEILPVGISFLAGRLLARESVNFPDRRRSPASDDPIIKDGATAAVIGEPLLSQDKAVGCLVLCSRQRDAFSPAHEQALREICRDLGVAVHNKQLLETGKRRSAELALLGEVSSMVTAELDVEELLEAVAEAVQRTFAFFDVSLFLVDKEAGEVVMTAQAGAFDDLFAKGYRQKIGQGMVGWTVEHGRTLVANDVTKEPRRIIASDREHRAKSELCVPIKVEDEVVGVINVESQELGAFDERDVAALETLAREVSKAIMTAKVASESRAARKYLDQIMTHLPIAITSCDLNGIYTHWSIGCERMFGYSADEIVGKRTPAFLIKDEFNLEEVLRICSEEGTYTGEFKAVTKDGGEIWIHDAMANLYDDSGRHIGYTGCIQDITGLKTAEQALLQEKEKLSDVVTALGAGVCLINRDRCILWCNKKTRDWFSPDGDVTGMYCYQLYCKRDTPCPDCMTLKALDTGEPQMEEHEVVTADGTCKHLLSVLTPVRDESGQTTQVLMLSQDITDHWQRMQEIQLLRDFGQILQQTLDFDKLMYLVLTCVTAGPGLGFNRAFLLLYDLQHNRLEGKMAVGPADHEEAARIYAAEAERKRSLTEILGDYDAFVRNRPSPIQDLAHNMVFNMNEEHELPVQVLNTKTTAFIQDAEFDERVTPKMRSLVAAHQFVCVPLLARGKPIAVLLADNLLTGQPISPRQVGLLNTFAAQAALALDNAEAYRRLDENLRQLSAARDRLVRSENLAAIGAMAGHVAHEIRNPLVTIGGFARSILRRTKPDNPCYEAASIIAEEVTRLEKILANVLNFTKPAKPRKQPGDLNEAVNAVCMLVQEELDQKKIQLEKKLAPDLPALHFDPDQIKQVLLNLLKNAVESIHDGGKITVETEEQKDYCRVQVTDTGTGMAPDVLESMFNPFFTTKPDGTGLGLALSRKLVEEHGGEILVQSTVGRGTTFTVLLPKDRQQSP